SRCDRSSAPHTPATCSAFRRPAAASSGTPSTSTGSRTTDGSARSGPSRIWRRSSARPARSRSRGRAAPPPAIAQERSSTPMSTSDTTTETSKDPASALPDYAPVPRSALGPALNEQGFFVGRVERNLYWITDGVYQSAFLTTRDGVVLLHAPPNIGGQHTRR